MSDSDARKIAEALAEILAYQGEEDHRAHCKRLASAERLLKRIAPEILAAAKAKVAE